MTLLGSCSVFYHEASMGAAFYDNGINPKQRRITFTVCSGSLLSQKYIPFPH